MITGEGRTDRQTLMGKLPYQVAQRAKKLGKRCVVISGDGDGTLVGDKVITLTDKDTPPRAAIAHAAALLAEKADLLLQKYVFNIIIKYILWAMPGIGEQYESQTSQTQRVFDQICRRL